MSGSEYDSAVTKMNVFARVSPEQKFRIIQTLKKQHVVAYQGDGINDAPSLKLADVSIAVDSATDIAKESADIVLLNKSLEVIINGITDGRSIFVNINKYIKYTMASNFGMFIALSVLYLFSATLPILPIQILLNSLLSDLPLTTVYSDKVDDDEVVKPEKHDVTELLLISVVLGLPTGLFERVSFLVLQGARSEDRLNNANPQVPAAQQNVLWYNKPHMMDYIQPILIILAVLIGTASIFYFYFSTDIFSSILKLPLKLISGGMLAIDIGVILVGLMAYETSKGVNMSVLGLPLSTCFYVLYFLGSFLVIFGSSKFARRPS